MDNTEILMIIWLVAFPLVFGALASCFRITDIITKQYHSNYECSVVLIDRRVATKKEILNAIYFGLIHALSAYITELVNLHPYILDIKIVFYMNISTIIMVAAYNSIGNTYNIQDNKIKNKKTTYLGLGLMCIGALLIR